MPEYERAARSVLKVIGIELDIVPEAVCCGGPVAESFTADWVYLSIYNLARIAHMGHDTVVTLCGSCTNALTRATQHLKAPEVSAEATRRLQPLGLAVPGEIAVSHILRVLADHEEDLRRQIVRPLSLRVALNNPCQVFRPGETMSFDDPMHPRIMRRLIEATGAEVVEYGGEDECCGATLYLADRRLSLEAGRRKLEATHTADALVYACGNCHLLLRHFQHAIVRDTPNLRQKTLLLPQIIGLALGLPATELGLREGEWL